VYKRAAWRLFPNYDCGRSLAREYIERRQWLGLPGNVEPVSRAAHGAQIPRILRIIFDLFPQSSDVHVESPRTLANRWSRL
jgi:hypothetical protein